MIVDYCDAVFGATLWPGVEYTFKKEENHYLNSDAKSHVFTNSTNPNTNNYIYNFFKRVFFLLKFLFLLIFTSRQLSRMGFQWITSVTGDQIWNTVHSVHQKNSMSFPPQSNIATYKDAILLPAMNETIQAVNVNYIYTSDVCLELS